MNENQTQAQQEKKAVSSFGHRFRKDVQNAAREGFVVPDNGTEEPKQEKLYIVGGEPPLNFDDYASMHQAIITSFNLSGIFSAVLKNIFKDYAGSRIYINGYGILVAEGWFGADKVVAFDKNFNQGPDSKRIMAVYGYNSAPKRIYSGTQDGIDLLSDIIVEANKNDWDKDGRIKEKRFGSYFIEMDPRTNTVAASQMNYPNYYDQRGSLCAVVNLDIQKMLKFVFGERTKKGRAEYLLTMGTGYMQMPVIQNQTPINNNLILHISQLEADHFRDIVAQCGMFQYNNMGGVVLH
jgi:hypothetical protein